MSTLLPDTILFSCKISCPVDDTPFFTLHQALNL
jgi:hypothetical protein